MGTANSNNKLASDDANNILLGKIIGKIITYVKLRFGGIMLLAALLLWLSPAFGSGTITENFTNNQYDTDLWYLWNMGQGTTAQVTNDRLEVTVSGNGYAGLNFSGYTLIGDFDVKVDFTLIDWPASNKTQIVMGPFNLSPTNLFQVGRANTPSAIHEQYFTIIIGNYKSTEVTGPTLSGTLRMVRTDNKMEGFYWDGAAWQSIGYATDASLGTRVGVGMNIGPYGGTYSGIPAKAAFSNIRIDYTTLGPSFWRGNPGPGIMLLFQD
jgi:hypothetical protein